MDHACARVRSRTDRRRRRPILVKKHEPRSGPPTAVSRSKKHRRRQRSEVSAADRDAPEADSASTRERTSSATTNQAAWLPDKKPVLRFLLIFGGLIGLFYAVFLLPPNEYPRVGKFFTTYLSFYARVSGSVLSILGHDITVIGQSISSPEFRVQVVRGCDAIEATALFVAAVIASPVALRWKIPGVLCGMVLLGVFNLARIVSLFYIGIHCSKKTFDTVHVEVWQPVFILLAVCLWLLWATWAKRRTTGGKTSRT